MRARDGKTVYMSRGLWSKWLSARVTEGKDVDERDVVGRKEEEDEED